MDVLKQVFTISILVLVTLLAAEGVLRLFPGLIPQTSLVYFQSDLRSRIATRMGLPTEEEIEYLARDDGGPPSRLFRYNPHVTLPFGTTMDSQGFCNTPADTYERHASFDAVIVGDSRTYCYDIAPEKSWVGSLERSTGRSVYNLGIPGQGLYEYVQQLKHFGLAKSPRVVVLAVCSGNDLRDAVRYYRYRGVEAQNGDSSTGEDAVRKVKPGRALLHALLENALGRTSYLYNLVLTSGAITVLRFRSQGEKDLHDFTFDLAFPDVTVPLNAGNVDRDEVEYAKLLRAGDVKVGVFNEALEAYVALAREHGFVPAVIYLPSAQNVYTEQVRYTDASLAELMPWVHESQLAYFRNKAEELGYPFMDLTPVLARAAAEAGSDDLLYMADDLHFTARGHAVVAETVSGALADWSEQARALAPGSAVVESAHGKLD